MAKNLKGRRICSVACKLSLEDLQALCRRQKLVCKQLAVTKSNFNDFEVEYLCNYKRRILTQGREYFLVKWKGYSESENTWESRRNLKCPKLLRQFFRDTEEALAKVKNHRDLTALDSDVASFVLQKAKQRVRLKHWEALLNQTSRHKGHISVINEVDLEGPPKDFVYISDYKVGEGMEINQVTVGCECEDCLGHPVKGCCPGAFQHRLAYTDRGLVRLRPGKPIYECNSRCLCGPDCANRIVQRGIQYNLCIFRTANGRGWGVRTLERIPKKAFVMEYLGEIITTEEAERRGEIYDRQGATYLFDLDYVEDVYTVDAGRYGNISHFVNHSCDPNLQVYNVFIDNVDERLPRIALFSTRAIKAGEELTFDYKMQIDPLDAESAKMDSNFSLAGLHSSPMKPIRMECKCGAENCRKYLF
ncbi:histone-lysine N-methyltransferase SUV39H1-A isoform X1 [Chanos chanos]|uniref:Histone-lysine N-methyltransferase n=1 Tax=Chanos chanos TaxID=29144 RepID=A0A6J2W9A0_CHACN|nr:histone-lysine N-methyltransferase SUV39H1-A-like isoform X1 [Chanos chanos]